MVFIGESISMACLNKLCGWKAGSIIDRNLECSKIFLSLKDVALLFVESIRNEVWPAFNTPIVTFGMSLLSVPPQFPF